MRHLFLPVFIWLSFPSPACTARGDTAYYDKLWKRVTAAHAADQEPVHYCIYRADTGGLFAATCYDIKTNRLEMKVQAKSIDSILNHAGIERFYPSGRRQSTEFYIPGQQTMMSTGYYDDTGSTVRYTQDDKTGDFISYYEDGRLKRQQKRDPLDSTKVTGKCFDREGNEIKFTPFEVMPVAPYSIPKYLTHKMKYPEADKKNGTEGRVIVKFCVYADGTVHDAELLNHVSPGIDAEALRAVTEMKKWKPGMQDDKAVAVYFTLPITFRLK